MKMLCRLYITWMTSNRVQLNPFRDLIFLFDDMRHNNRKIENYSIIVSSILCLLLDGLF